MFKLMRICRRPAAPVALLFSLVLVSSGVAADWPTFRGADRTGVSKETGLMQSWPTDGPPKVWQAKGAGRGYSSLAVAAGRIFTLGDGVLGTDDKDEYLRCFSDESGELIWKTKTGSPWTNGQPNWQSSRATPTVDGELVYVVTPHGVLICCESATGKERWRKDFKAEFDGKKGDNWGYSESVLIDGDLLVCTPGASKNTVVALDKTTGELKWKTSRDGDAGAGHSSIVISTVGDMRVYVQNTASGMMGIRASDGTLLWQFPQKITAMIPSPLVKDDLVFFVEGYAGKGGGGALLKQIPGENGTMKIEVIYPVNTKLANKHGGVVLVGDHVYGDTDDKGVPYCADLMTGEIKWSKRGSGSNSASIISAEGMLYIHFASGVMALAKASPDDYVEVGSFKVPGSGERPGWSHPVIANGRLYVRENDVISCYDIKAK